MRKFLLMIVLFVTTLSFGQFEAIDTKMDEIPESLESSTTSIANYISENFTTDDDKIRAVFYWTASTISYDVENMFNQPSNQTVDFKIKRTLETKKGVCMHYAEVFKDIANKVGVRTVIIDGYTKQDGKIVTIGHSWNASKINETWYLFDPTWGSGYVNNQQYFRKLNNDFFKADVVQFGLSHMPFDYLWQLKEYPISNQEFYDSKTASELTTVKFDFNSEIQKNESLSNIERVTAVINRVEKGGLINNLIIEKIAISKKEIDYFKETEAIAKLEIIVPQFNEATKQLNEFIYFRNHKFLPTISDEELRNKLQIPYDLITKYQEEVSKIIVSKENASNLNSLKKAISATKLIADNQQVFLKEYLAKNTAERAKMFVKVITIKK